MTRAEEDDSRAWQRAVAGNRRPDKGRPNKVRIEWIDTAKGISILLVTLLHVALLSEAAGLEVSKLVRLNVFLAPVRMPLFFAAAGVFAGPALSQSWSTLLKSRVAFYVWLFVVWTVVRWVFFALVIANPDNPSEGSSIWDIAWTMVMPVTGLWFLWSLAIFFVASKALSSFGVRSTIFAAAAVSLVAMAVSDADSSSNGRWLLNNLAHRNTAMYFVFFYGAARFPQLVTSLSSWRTTRGLATMLTFFAFLSIASFILPHPLHVLTKFASSIVGVAALFLVARVLDGWPPTRRILRYVGLNTLPIYVAQIPLIAVFVTILQVTGAASLGQGALLLMPVGVIAAAWAALKMRDIFVLAGADWLYRLPRVPPGKRNTPPRTTTPPGL